MSKSFGRQRHIDVGFDTFAFDYRAAPCVPARGWKPQHESMADRKVAAAKDLAARARSDDSRQPILRCERTAISPALNVCSLTSMTIRP